LRDEGAKGVVVDGSRGVVRPREEEERGAFEEVLVDSPLNDGVVDGIFSARSDK
jgi:hypothetical protein